MLNTTKYSFGIAALYLEILWMNAQIQLGQLGQLGRRNQAQIRMGLK